MRFSNWVSLSVLILVAVGCKPPMDSAPDRRDHVYTGQLSDSVYLALKNYLLATTHRQPRDTIIIKYEFNGETCWDRSDMTYADSFFINAGPRIEQYNLWLDQKRTGASIWRFREPGNEINKNIKWNKTIIIDSSKTLFKLFFSRREICGSSILVTPDRRYVFFKRDSHEFIRELTPAHVKGFLEKKYTYKKFYEYLRKRNWYSSQPIH